MNDQRARMTTLLDRLDDDGLSAPAFNHFFDFGWQTAEDGLAASRLHHWSELFEFSYRLVGRPPEYPAEITHEGLRAYMTMFGVFADPDASRRFGPFTVTFDYVSKGWAWTIEAREGRGTVEERLEPNPDLRMTLTPEAFLHLFKKTKNPMVLMLRREIKPSPLKAMGRFSKIWKDPPLDRELSTQGVSGFAAG
jgi:hypothetical protein